MTSQPRVFIIESLAFSDEEKHLHEGRILSRILRLSMLRDEAQSMTRSRLRRTIGSLQKLFGVNTQ